MDQAKRVAIIADGSTLLVSIGALVGANRIQGLGQPWVYVASGLAALVGIWLIGSVLHQRLKFRQEFGLSRRLGVTHLLVSSRESIVVLVPLAVAAIQGSVWGLAAMLYFAVLGTRSRRLMRAHQALAGVAVVGSSTVLIFGEIGFTDLSQRLPHVAFLVSDVALAGVFGAAVWISWRAWGSGQLARKAARLNSICIALIGVGSLSIMVFKVPERLFPYAILVALFIWLFILRARMIEASTPESWGFLLLYLRSCGTKGSKIWRVSQEKVPNLFFVPVVSVALISWRMNIISVIIVVPCLLIFEFTVNQAAIMDKTIIPTLAETEKVFTSSRVGIGAILCAVIAFSASGIFIADVAVDLTSGATLIGLFLLTLASVILAVLNHRNASIWSRRVYADV